MMRTGLVTVIFLALLLVGCVVYPGIGARFIAPQTVLQAFLHFDPQDFDHNVIVRLRLPRLAAALLTGASLGVAGALLQAVIRNPLGEPHILGLNAGAALAVVAASALGLAFPVGRPLLASTGGRVIVPVDIAAFLRRAFRGNANESYFMRRGAIGVRVLNNGCNPDS